MHNHTAPADCMVRRAHFYEQSLRLEKDPGLLITAHLNLAKRFSCYSVHQTPLIVKCRLLNRSRFAMTSSTSPSLFELFELIAATQSRLASLPVSSTGAGAQVSEGSTLSGAGTAPPVLSVIPPAAQLPSFTLVVAGGGRVSGSLGEFSFVYGGGGGGSRPPRDKCGKGFAY